MCVLGVLSGLVYCMYWTKVLYELDWHCTGLVYTGMLYVLDWAGLQCGTTQATVIQKPTSNDT